MKYDEKKAAQVAAFFLRKSGNKGLEIMKLMKLIYLSDRKSIERFGELITGDHPCSLPKGPVPSLTYDHAKGCIRSVPDGWSSWVTTRKGLKHFLQAEKADHPLSLLCRADILVLSEVWETYGHHTSPELSEITHENCPEWSDPRGSSTPITYERMARAVGYSEADARAIEERIRTQREIESYREQLGI